MVIRFKKQKQCLPEELEAGDCWIAISLANPSGFILATRVGKHTDELIEQLVVSSQGKTACQRLNSDDWGAYEQVLSPEVMHHIGKDRPNHWREITVLSDNKPDDGIADRISLASCGSKRK